MFITMQHVGGAPCGCCWAFATIGVTECIVGMALGHPICADLGDVYAIAARGRRAVRVLLGVRDDRGDRVHCGHGPGAAHLAQRAAAHRLRQGRCATHCLRLLILL